MLQWGRTFSSAETKNSSPNPIATEQASMGPHFFKCGNLNKRPLLAPPAEASMGPHFFKCGNMRNAWRRALCFSASMGPHFFKCGNIAPMRRLPLSITGFNGAALFQVRKREFYRQRAIAKKVLQWGRTFSSAETRLNYG